MIEGALPSADDEVALAPGNGRGDRRRRRRPVRADRRRVDGDLTVSGLAFVPEGPHNEYDGGAWLTPDGFDELIDGFKFHFVDVTAARRRRRRTTVAARINREVGDGARRSPRAPRSLDSASPPSRVGELKQLRRLPLFLAAFLGAAGGHRGRPCRRHRGAPAATRPRGAPGGRPHPLADAVDRAHPGDVLALVGLVIGVPLGIALGRSLWRSVAESTPVLHVVPVAVLALILIAPDRARPRRAAGRLALAARRIAPGRARAAHGVARSGTLPLG